MNMHLVSKRGSYRLSFVYCRISRWNIVEPVHPITAHQYTSTGAKIKSSRRFLARPFPCLSVALGYKGENGGSEKTVSAFSRVSQWAVLGREEGARNDDRSMQKNAFLLEAIRLTIRGRLTHDMRNHSCDRIQSRTMKRQRKGEPRCRNRSTRRLHTPRSLPGSGCVNTMSASFDSVFPLLYLFNGTRQRRF